MGNVIFKMGFFHNTENEHVRKVYLHAYRAELSCYAIVQHLVF